MDSNWNLPALNMSFNAFFLFFIILDTKFDVKEHSNGLVYHLLISLIRAKIVFANKTSLFLHGRLFTMRVAFAE